MSFEKIQNILDSDEIYNLKFVVIMGMPKSGTTLPITLLDSHPNLLVFPEEIRFFERGYDSPNYKIAYDNFISDKGNLAIRDNKNKFFKFYNESDGRGLGKSDYSNIDFEFFINIVKDIFVNNNCPFKRYVGIFLAFNCARNGYNGQYNKIFISKSPHNERYLYLWKKMLKNNVKFIYTIRNPFELLLSRRNIDKMYNWNHVKDVKNFVQDYRGRYDYVNRLLTDDNLYILNYDEISDEPAGHINKLIKFLGIKYDPILLSPTKNGVEWSGNSSRGIVSDKIFKNPKKAEKDLDKKDFNYLRNRLNDINKKYKYDDEVYTNSRLLSSMFDILFFYKRLFKLRLWRYLRYYKPGLYNIIHKIKH